MTEQIGNGPTSLFAVSVFFLFLSAFRPFFERSS